MEERACDNFTKCVRQSHICDGIVDCNDEQDEMDCGAWFWRAGLKVLVTGVKELGNRVVVRI